MRRPDLDNLPEIVLPEGYELRPFQPGDGPSASATLSLAFEDEWTEERVLRDLAENACVRTMFVVVTDGQVVSTASAAEMESHPGSGYVHFVGTHPEHTGKRLGYMATLATLHEFRRLGYPDAVLNTDDHRLPAIRTYMNLGFNMEATDPTHFMRWLTIVQALEGRELTFTALPDGPPDPEALSTLFGMLGDGRPPGFPGS